MCRTRAHKGLFRNGFFRRLFRSYRKRAGCVVLQKFENQLKVLLIGSTKSQGKDYYWKIPAGGIEQGETEVQAAARETFEESGVVGTATKWLHSYKDEQRMTQTCFYLMTEFHLVKENEYEEGLKGRQRKWYTVKEALEIIPEDQKKALQRAIETVEKEN